MALSHSRMYLISTTHSFLISYRFFFSLAPYLSSTPRLPHHLYGREHYRRMLRFAPLADFLKVLLITTWSPSSSFLRRISYHYPPPMILAKDLRKSIHSYRVSLRMRTGTDSFLQNDPPSSLDRPFHNNPAVLVPIRPGAYAVTLLSSGTYL